MKDFNKDGEESFLEYLDANNLHGCAMVQPLPVDDFKKMRLKQIKIL